MSQQNAEPLSVEDLPTFECGNDLRPSERVDLAYRRQILSERNRQSKQDLCFTHVSVISYRVQPLRL